MLSLEDLHHLPWAIINTASHPLLLPGVMDIPALEALLQRTKIHPAYLLAQTRTLTHVAGRQYTAGEPACFFNEYRDGHYLAWHQDAQFAEFDKKVCVIGVKGTGTLYFKHEINGSVTLPEEPLLNMSINAGDVIVFTSQAHRRLRWFHGGPTGERTSLVYRF